MEIQATRMGRGVRLVVVEYDGKSGRVRSKPMSDGAARRFYQKMSMAGANPKVVAAVRRPA